ncbi:MAG TPA: outer membrane beta-barrel protein, partial [Balneolaceae bacterium]|nr:outer membrane beta-barrel protein [Balneolaceae bacterium]
LTTGSHNEPLALVNNRDKFTRRQFTHVTLGLVMGPDLSTAGSIAHFYDPGYRLGATIDYNFSPDWGITTGIIRTRTRYTAGSGDYQLPQGYLSNNESPKRTRADCVLLDIPVSLKYRFLQFNHSRLYATAGVSSYIMLNEKYRFTYKDYQSGLAQGWSGKTGTRHWLSNASFSIGYEFDIRGNWSLRAEPFIKIPLKEVGWGNVKLYSMGSIISLNYNLK